MKSAGSLRQLELDSLAGTQRPNRALNAMPRSFDFSWDGGVFDGFWAEELQGQVWVWVLGRKRPNAGAHRRLMKSSCGVGKRRGWI